MSPSFYVIVQLNTAAWLLMAFCLAQEVNPAPGHQTSPETNKQESRRQEIRDLPAEWLIGAYVPNAGPLQPLTNRARPSIYVHQTFLNLGAYAARMVTRRIHAARGVPRAWDGVMRGRGRR